MDAFLATFSDVIGFLAQLFKLAAVFPSFIFVLLNEVIILPGLSQKGLGAQIVALDLLDKLLIAAIFSVVLGYTLTIINTPLIRFFEGYSWRATWLGILLRKCQRKRLQILREHIPNLERETSQLKEESKYYETGNPQRELLHRRLKVLEKRLRDDKLLYPPQIHGYFPSQTPILPTALGNTIAAFEDYPSERYGIDAVTLWPRLLPTLTKENYASYVEREKAGLDFALNMCFLLSLFSVEMVYVGLLFDQDCFVWLLGASFSALFACLFYKVSITGAFSWGTTVRVAFDLYRYHLLLALHACPPPSFFVEVENWDRLSRFVREGLDSGKDHALSEQDMCEILHYSRIKKEAEAQETPTDS